MPTEGGYSPPVRRVFAATGVTDGSGNIVFSFTPVFAAPPVVTLTLQGAVSTDPVDLRVTSVSASSCSVHARRSPATAIALLGLTLLGSSVPLVGATIHCQAVEAGQT